MNAPWPLNPSVGQEFQGSVWNGNAWVGSQASAFRVVTQVFPGPGATGTGEMGGTFTYVPTPGLASLTVECVGGGGGGGGAVVQTATWALGGGGGGAGGYSRKTLPASLVLGGVVVNVGNAGLGGVGAAGGNGQPTNFGAFCLANGGFGGQVNDLTQNTAPNWNGWGGGGAGADWTNAIGDLVSGGNGGGEGSYENGASGVAVYGGIGAGGPWGGAGPVLSGVTSGEHAQGSNAQGAGAGGSGGAVDMVVATAKGGDGGTGVCIVTEYCAGFSGGGCGPNPNPQDPCWPNPCWPPGGWGNDC